VCEFGTGGVESWVTDDSNGGRRDAVGETGLTDIVSPVVSAKANAGVAPNHNALLNNHLPHDASRAGMPPAAKDV